MTTVIQLIPSFATQDAIGMHTQRIDTLLRELGYETAIYADEFDPALSHLAEPFAKLRRHAPRNAWFLYQASTNSRMANWLRGRPRVLLNYHNVTPHELTAPWEPAIARLLWQARREIGGLAPTTQRAFTVSHYNATDLFRLGFSHALVAPPLIDLPTSDTPGASSAGSRSQSRGGRAHWLFVGRIFPNKNQLFLIRAFAIYRRLFDSAAILTLVGGTASANYLGAIQDLIDAEGLTESAQLRTGLSPTELHAAYRSATLFTSASLHEGFGFPFVEAFAEELPVLALATSAVTETVGNAGWLLKDASPLDYAAAAHLLHSDWQTRTHLIEQGRQRLDSFAPDQLRSRYATVFDRMIGSK